MTQTSAVRPLVGTTAPTFRAEDTFGNTIDLQSYRGRSVLLSFYRNAACALCNLRVHELIQKFPAYQLAGLDVVAVFEAPRENLLQYVGKQDAPFPIIGDPQGRLYDLYGVEVSEAKVAASMAAPEGQARVQAAAAAGFELIREEGSNFYRIPADFLIDGDGILRRAYYAELVGQHLPFTEIDVFLNRAAKA